MVEKKIYFVNHKLRGNSHEIVDVSLIVILSKLYSAVEIFLSASRVTALKEICHKYLIRRNRTDLEEKMNWHRSSLDVRSLFWMDVFVSLKDMWLMLKGEKNAIYLFSYGNNRFSIHLVNLLARLTKKNVVICAHNELDVLIKDDYSIRSNWHYLINRFYRRTKWADTLKILVLGDFIVDKLKTVLPQDRVAHFITLDHPYFQTEDGPVPVAETKATDGEVNIGLAGSVEPGSSMNNLIEFSSIIEGSNIYLNIISRMYVDIPALKSLKNVRFLNPNNVRLGRDQYDSLLSKMDYLYYPHAVDKFQFSASGSIFEAIAKRKPAIVYSNPHFAYLFKKYGCFGYIVESTAEIKDILPQLNGTNLNDMVGIGDKMMEALDPLAMELNLG